jgi:hypothetical protein
MKKVLCVALWLAIAAPAHASTISLLATSPVQTGSAFDVIVQVSDVFSGRDPSDLLVGFGFNLAVGNPSIFQFLGATAGLLFFDFSGFPGGPTVAAIASNPAGIGPADFSGPLTLATLHFKSLLPGASSIGVTADLSDPNQGLIYAFLPYGGLSGSTNVTSVAATVPEPLPLLLVCLAVCALFLTQLTDAAVDEGSERRAQK